MASSALVFLLTFTFATTVRASLHCWFALHLLLNFGAALELFNTSNDTPGKLYLALYTFVCGVKMIEMCSSGRGHILEVVK
jgi:lipoprotein signal peptidase